MTSPIAEVVWPSHSSRKGRSESAPARSRREITPRLLPARASQLEIAQRPPVPLGFLLERPALVRSCARDSMNAPEARIARRNHGPGQNAINSTDLPDGRTTEYPLPL